MSAMFINHMAVMLSIDPESGRILDANPRPSIFYVTAKTNAETAHTGYQSARVGRCGSASKNGSAEKQEYFVFPTV
jgi:hypothetical protein